MTPVNKIKNFLLAFSSNADRSRKVRTYTPLFLMTHIKNIHRNNFIAFFLFKNCSSSKYSINNNTTMANDTAKSESCADVKERITCIGKRKKSVDYITHILFILSFINDKTFQITYNETLICNKVNAAKPIE